MDDGAGVERTGRGDTIGLAWWIILKTEHVLYRLLSKAELTAKECKSLGKTTKKRE